MQTVLLNAAWLFAVYATTGGLLTMFRENTSRRLTVSFFAALIGAAVLYAIFLLNK